MIIYISSGGPGNPLESSEQWEENYFKLINDIFDFNKKNHNKKYLFLICHSFQMVSQHLGIGVVGKRKSTSFGVMPIHLTDEGVDEPFLMV